MINSSVALAVPLEHAPVPPEQVVAGTPSTGSAVLGPWASGEYGVWEMTPGTMTDVEVDELFVVVAGAASVEFVGTGRVVRLEVGSVCTLSAGDETVWNVTETLRKVWVS